MPRWKRASFKLALAVMLLTLLLLAECVSYQAIVFDQSDWLKGGVKRRGRMADDLVTRGLLIGKTKAQVVTMLGSPDREDGEIIEYRVAHIPRCSWIWDCYLGVHFGQTGEVKKAFISD